MDGQVCSSSGGGKSKKRFCWWVGLALLAGLAIGGYFFYQNKLFYHFATVDPGRVYRSGCLSESGLQAVYDKTGFKTIVAAMGQGEADADGDGWYTRETEFCKRKGLRFVFFPRNAGEPPLPEHVKQFNEIISDPAQLPVLIHCYHGVVRTAAVVAIYRIAKMGHTGEQVWETVPRFGHNLEQYHKIKTFILNFDLKDQLRKAK